MPRDKHWMALVEPGDASRQQLHFVQNLDPLRVLRCSLVGICQFVQRDEQLSGSSDREAGFIFRDSFSHLRGGTPFELYRWPYFIRYVSVSGWLMWRGTTQLSSGVTSTDRVHGETNSAEHPLTLQLGD